MARTGQSVLLSREEALSMDRQVYVDLAAQATDPDPGGLAAARGV
jgi:hypothetical protein